MITQQQLQDLADQIQSVTQQYYKAANQQMPYELLDEIFQRLKVLKAKHAETNLPLREEPFNYTRWKIMYALRHGI